MLNKYHWIIQCFNSQFLHELIHITLFYRRQKVSYVDWSRISKASVRNCRDHNFCFKCTRISNSKSHSHSVSLKLHIVSFPLHLTVLIQCIIHNRNSHSINKSQLVIILSTSRLSPKSPPMGNGNGRSGVNSSKEQCVFLAPTVCWVSVMVYLY